MNKKEVIISGTKIELHDELKQGVHDKVGRLFRHEENIIRINVELEYDTHRKNADEYIAKGHIEIRGKPMIVSVCSNDMYKSIDEMVDKLDRMIRRRSRLNRVKRKTVHHVDIPADLPKVATA